MRESLDIAINWIPIALSLAAYSYLFVLAIEARQRLTFFCGRPWMRGKKPFHVVVGLFEPDTDSNDCCNSGVVVVDESSQRVLQVRDGATVDGNRAAGDAPLRLTMPDGSRGELHPTASMSWVSHAVSPTVLEKEDVLAGKGGSIVMAKDGSIWRYQTQASHCIAHSRWQELVSLYSSFLSWDDAQAAKAVAELLPSRLVETVMCTSFEFSRKANADHLSALFVGGPRGAPQLEGALERFGLEIRIEQDRIAANQSRYVRIGDKKVRWLGIEQDNKGLAVIVRMRQGATGGVFTCVFGGSARITKLAGEWLGQNWRSLSSEAKKMKCENFIAVFEIDKHKDALPSDPTVFRSLDPARD